jgi:methyl farnesoate epoxidase/farnesoate epoxidase
LPLLGYAPFVAEHHPVYPFKAMEKLAEIYGPVVGFYIGPFQPFISVCGNEAVREASNNEDLNGRPHLASIEARTFYERLGLNLINCYEDLIFI